MSIPEKFFGIEFSESFVRSWSHKDKELVFEVTFSIWPGHPNYENPLNKGSTCYKSGILSFSRIRHIEGLIQMSDVKCSSAQNEDVDYGKIESFSQICHNRFNLSGDFGNVIIESRFPKIIISPF